MKIFAILNEESGTELGYFFFFEKKGDYYIELNEGLDEWDCPFILDHYVRAHQLTIGYEHSRLFITQRIIPSDRQNIGSILRENGLEEYDEVKLFIIADGRCAQDDCSIRQITWEKLPENIRIRQQRMVITAAVLDAGQYMLSFADGTMALMDISECHSDDYQMSRMLGYAKGLSDVSVTSGGAEICFGGNFYLPYDYLYDHSEHLPFSMDDLKKFLKIDLLTTQDMMDELNCTRQNVNDLVKREQLTPLIHSGRVQIFSRSEYHKLQ